MIDYNIENQKIFILKNWTITTLNSDLKCISKVKLDFPFPLIRKITRFSYNTSQNYFHIICADFKQVYSYTFDIIGNIVSNQTLPFNRNEILLKLNNDEYIDLLFVEEDYSYEAQCKIYFSENEILNIDLHEELDKYEKDWYGYEYVESIVSTNRKSQFSFISVHANYGVQGVKIFQLNSLKGLDLIYDMDDLVFEGAFHNLTFNPIGEKFSLLLYEIENLRNYFFVCEYSINDHRKPYKIYKTEYAYMTDNIKTQYLNESILCIIRNSDIILFDLVNGKTIEVLIRDLNSDYFVSINILIYQYEEKIIKLEY